MYPPAAQPSDKRACPQIWFKNKPYICEFSQKYKCGDII